MVLGTFHFINSMYVCIYRLFNVLQYNQFNMSLKLYDTNFKLTYSF